MNGLGGDNFWLIHDGRRRRLRGLNAAGRAAAAATLENYRAQGATLPTRGGAAHLAAAGAVSGWWEPHRYSRAELGSVVDWPALLEGAIAPAREGFEVSACQRRMTEGAAAALFEAGAPEAVRRTLWPLFHPDRLTARFAQPDLATTLTEIAENGAETFYRGALAKRIAAGAAVVGTPLTVQDLAEHRADWVEPLRLRYRDGVAVGFPPPPQGFAPLAILGFVQSFDLPAPRAARP